MRRAHDVLAVSPVGAMQAQRRPAQAGRCRGALASSRRIVARAVAPGVAKASTDASFDSFVEYIHTLQVRSNCSGVRLRAIAADTRWGKCRTTSLAQQSEWTRAMRSLCVTDGSGTQGTQMQVGAMQKGAHLSMASSCAGAHVSEAPPTSHTSRRSCACEAVAGLRPQTANHGLSPQPITV
jgi:hypothetical protein